MLYAFWFQIFYHHFLLDGKFTEFHQRTNCYFLHMAKNVRNPIDERS
jgi:hypothetical protein